MLAQLESIVGEDGLLTATVDMDRYLVDLSGIRPGHARAVVRPKTTAEVAQIVRLCVIERIAITAHGGGTGFCGGAIPWGVSPHLVLSLERMRRIRAVNVASDAMIVEAGCTLAEVHSAAAESDRLFPVSHGGEGTSQIGGMIATNAGGSNVIRYGMARAQVLGLEVVLADGAIWDGLRMLRKDNAGYDLKQLFIGSEGTLGIVTAAALMLRPKPVARATALVAVADPQAALDLFRALRADVGELISAFELIPRKGLELHLSRATASVEPFGARYPWMVLIEIDTVVATLNPTEILQSALGQWLDSGLLPDAVIAVSESQRSGLWALREGLAEVQASIRRVLKNDNSVPVAAIPAFIAEAEAAVTLVLAGAIPIPFGHIGDGNIHFNVMAPHGMDTEEFQRHVDDLSAAINEVALSLGGSIAAEHGLGQLKRDKGTMTKSPTEQDMMRRIKHALDPDGIFNPGKVVAMGT